MSRFDALIVINAKAYENLSFPLNSCNGIEIALEMFQWKVQEILPESKSLRPNQIIFYEYMGENSIWHEYFVHLPTTDFG